jgi:predicted ribosomally synthesized peptide with nif11-like leader
MSKESAKKLIIELETNGELKAKVQGVNDPAELLKIAVDSGYDVTMEEIIEADRALRREKAAETDEKLSFDDLEDVAGGLYWYSDEAPDGHEMACAISYHARGYCEENNVWCTREHYLPDNKVICHSSTDANIWGDLFGL